MAPELPRTQKATAQTDAYSFGIVMLECFTLGSLPFAALSNDQLIQHLMKHRQSPIGSRSSLVGVYDNADAISGLTAIDGILAQCTHMEAHARPTFATMMQQLHPTRWVMSDGALGVAIDNAGTGETRL